MPIAVDPARTERLVRGSLALSCPFNLVGAWVFANPASPMGQMLGLPASVDPFYAAACALFVVLFGCAYGWLAMQRDLDRPLLWLGVTGKAGFFVLVGMLWMRAVVHERLVIAASADMAFAAFWFWWLMRVRYAATESNR